MDLKLFIHSPFSSLSPSLWPSPFSPSFLPSITGPILSFLHHVRLSFLKLWAKWNSLFVSPDVVTAKTKLTLYLGCPSILPICLTTHSTSPPRCPMGPSHLSWWKATFWLSLYGVFSLTAFFISVTPNSTFLFFWLITLGSPLILSHSGLPSIYENISIPLLSKVLKSPVLPLWSKRLSPSLQYWNTFYTSLPPSLFLSSVLFSWEARVSHLKFRCSCCSVLSILSTFPFSQKAKASKALWSGSGSSDLSLPHCTDPHYFSIAIHLTCQVCSS